jgi:hypothetical protein
VAAWTDTQDYFSIQAFTLADASHAALTAAA